MSHWMRAWTHALPIVLGLMLFSACGEPGGSVATPTADPAPFLVQVDPAFDALPGATAYFGQLGDAVYRIEMPTDWNGGLVLWAHGYEASNELSVRNPPDALREAFVAGGYAWAASSFSANGYVPGVGMDDTLALKRHFEDEFGRASRTYLAGASMGGNVTTLALEQHPVEFDGALALCGALAGVEQIDYLLSWALLAEHFAGVELPIGTEGGALANALLFSVSPALGSPAEPKPAGEAFANAVMHLSGGPRPFFTEGFARQYTANFALLLVDPARADLISSASTNEDTTYAIDEGFGITSAELNAAVRRLPPARDARDGQHPEVAPMSGRLAVPLITLHNTGDLFVPVSQEVSYARKAEAAGAADLLVQRAIRAGGHCQFSAAEVLTAWDDLVSWVESGIRPGGDDLTGDLTDIGRTYTDPIREGDPGGIR